MKQYVYSAAEIGLKKFSDGILRLDCEVVVDPREADIFVCPEPLFKFTDKSGLRRRFRYLSEYYGAVPHVFFDLSEHFTTYDSYMDSIFIRAALKKTALEIMPNAISWPWPSKDYGYLIDKPFEVDVTFHGWLSGLARKVSVRACATSEFLTADIQTYPNFYGHQPVSEQVAREARYANGLGRARMALTGESIPGVLPYRFFEAMSAGRCQTYIGHNYVLPFYDLIPYEQFVQFVQLDAADEADVCVLDWKTRNSDEDFRTRGRIAREHWERYLDPAKWVELMTMAVERKLNQIKGRS